MYANRKFYFQSSSVLNEVILTTLIHSCDWSKPQSRIMRSDIYWFAEICNSQCLSHFAASFIASRAEVSIVKGEKEFVSRGNLALRPSLRDSTPMLFRGSPELRLGPGTFSIRYQFTIQVYGSFLNDPSAGSPTETLLRLILPLSDKVYETSRVRNISARAQSESFTGSLNR